MRLVRTVGTVEAWTVSVNRWSCSGCPQAEFGFALHPATLNLLKPPAQIEGMSIPVEMAIRGMDRLTSTMETVNFRHLVGEELDVVFAPQEDWMIVEGLSELTKKPDPVYSPFLPAAFFEEPPP